MKPIALIPLFLGFTLSCGSSKKSSEKAPSQQALKEPYAGDLTTGATLKLSEPKVIYRVNLEKDQSKDPRREAFLTGLYLKMRSHCVPCHAGQNSIPFASPGEDLAFITVQKYIKRPLEESPIVRQLKAGHSGADPKWASEWAPLLESVLSKK